MSGIGEVLKAEYVAPVPTIVPLPIDIDGHRVKAETAAGRLGGYMLAIVTAIPGADLGVELNSTYVGHPQVRTLSTHLLLAIGTVAQSQSDEHEASHVDPLHAPSGCLYDHAMRLQDFLRSLGHESRLHVGYETVLAVDSA